MVAYRGSTSTITVIECKSYMDCKGVQLAEVINIDMKGAKRCKLSSR